MLHLICTILHKENCTYNTWRQDNETPLDEMFMVWTQCIAGLDDLQIQNHLGSCYDVISRVRLVGV